MNNFLYDNYNTKKLEYKLKKNGIPSLLLMMRAGFNLYQIVKENIEYEEIIVLAGPGNNGGDAISFAIQAKLNNEKITCLSLAEHKNNSRHNWFEKASYKDIVKSTLWFTLLYRAAVGLDINIDENVVGKSNTRNS